MAPPEGGPAPRVPLAASNKRPPDALAPKAVAGGALYKHVPSRFMSPAPVTPRGGAASPAPAKPSEGECVGGLTGSGGGGLLPWSGGGPGCRPLFKYFLVRPRCGV